MLQLHNNVGDDLLGLFKWMNNKSLTSRREETALLLHYDNCTSALIC